METESSPAEVFDFGAAQMSIEKVYSGEESVTAQPEVHRPISEPCQKCSILSKKLIYYQKDNSRLKKKIRELKEPLPIVGIILPRAYRGKMGRLG